MLAIATTLAALASVAAAHPTSAGFARLSSQSVDVRLMLAQGGELQAQILHADLTAALRRSLGGRTVGDSGLVLRVRSLLLSANAGSQGSRFFDHGQSDYLDGEVLLVGYGGVILARHPQLSALPSSSGGAWYDPDSEQRRITAIAEHYAQWLDCSLLGR